MRSITFLGKRDPKPRFNNVVCPMKIIDVIILPAKVMLEIKIRVNPKNACKGVQNQWLEVDMKESTDILLTFRCFKKSTVLKWTIRQNHIRFNTFRNRLDILQNFCRI